MSKEVRNDSIAFINGEFYFTSSPLSFTALYVKAGVIMAIGNDKEILSNCDSKTVVLDMKGKFLMPGFTDTHAHLLKIGKNLSKDKSIPSKDSFKTCYSKATKAMLKLGITSVQTNDTFILGNNSAVLEFYKEMDSSNNISPRITPQLYIKNVKELSDLINSNSYQEYKLRHLKSPPVKIRIDGTVDDRGAALKEEYLDQPESFGTYEHSEEELIEILKITQKESMQIIFQATGDGAIERCLTVLEKNNNPSSISHRIESCKVASENTYRRMKSLGLMADISPVSLSVDMHILLQRLGAERSRICDSWKSMILNGIPVGAGSNGFDELNPCVGIRTLIFRQDENKEPKYGWIPSQRLSSMESFGIYSSGGAKVCLEDSFRGTLSIGMAADIIAFMDNPLTASYDDFLEMQVGLTVVDGRIAFLQ